MGNAITFFINGFRHLMSNLININMAAFITTISFHKLSNTYYSYWKALVESYFKRMGFMEYPR